MNLSAIIGKSVEARERRLVPEAIEQFFVQAAPQVGLHPRPTAPGSHAYRIGRLPRRLVQIGDWMEGRFGRLGRDYTRIAFAKELLKTDPTLEWVTPGHPLFESVRAEVLERVTDHLRRGAVFLDLHRHAPSVFDVFAASVKDGCGNTLHRSLFVVETDAPGQMCLHQPTVFHEITPALANECPLPPAILRCQTACWSSSISSSRPYSRGSTRMPRSAPGRSPW